MAPGAYQRAAKSPASHADSSTSHRTADPGKRYARFGAFLKSATIGPGGRETNSRYRFRRLLTKGDQRLEDNGRERLLGLLLAGYPKVEVTTPCQTDEALRELYTHTDPALALQ